MNGSQFRELFHGKRLLWHTLSGCYYAGLDQFCPVGAVACWDYGREFELLRRRSGARFYALERQTGSRLCPTKDCIEEIATGLLPQLRQLLSGSGSERWMFIAPYRCRTLEALAAETGHATLILPASLCDFLSCKSNLFAGLDALGLPRLPGRWISLAASRYHELASALGTCFVAQLDSGVSGSGTAVIRSAKDFESAAVRFGQASAWVAPHAGDLSFNVNGLALAGGTVVCGPSLQLQGLEICGAAPGAYCGNDYSAAAAVSREIRYQIFDQTERIGDWIASMGYRGIFGLDFVLDNASSKVYAVDLNPRWQGSTALLTQAEALAGRLPLAAADIACRLGAIGEDEVLREGVDHMNPVEGAQLIIRNQRQWSVARGDLKPGAYRLNPGLTYKRPGVSIADCATPGEVLLTGGIPEPGTLAEPRSYLMRICSPRSVMAADSVSVLPSLAKAIEEALSSLRLAPAARAAAPAAR